MLDDHHRAGGQQVAARQLGQDAVGLFDVGGIAGRPRRTAVLAPASLRSALRTSAPMTVRAVVDARLAQVAAERRERRAVPLDEDRGRGAARQRLQARGRRCRRRGRGRGPGGGPRMLKIASRTFAAVGRVRDPRGTKRRRPRSRPPVRRM